MSNKIIFFTRQEPKETLAQYLRILKLRDLFSDAYNTEVTLFNTYEPINRIKLFIKTKKRIKEYLKTLDDNTKVFVIDNLVPGSIKVLENYARKHNIKIYIDIVEYADPKEKRFGIISPSYWINHNTINHSVTKNMTVIAISDWFVRYYAKKGIRTLFIPNLIDEKEDYSSFIVDRKEDKVSFIFAGYPQKKDALDMIVKALVNIYKNRTDFIFNIAGISEEDFFNKYPHLNSDKDIIKSFTKFHGQLSREEIRKLYYVSDYSIILRDPNLLVTQSGFPTKFSESLGYARPVIANDVSDVHLYLKDGYNGYFVDEFNIDDLSSAIKKALDNKENRSIMFKNALESSKEHFSPSIYINLLRNEK